MVLSYTKESLTYGVLSEIIANVAKEGKVAIQILTCLYLSLYVHTYLEVLV